MKNTKYSRISPEQRYQISALRKAGHSLEFIAEQIGKHRSSISKELKRNSCSKGKYNPKLAQEFCNDRIKEKKKRSSFTKKMKDFIEEKLTTEQWSPEQIVGYCKENQIDMVSHEWIYLHIYKDKEQGGKLYENLRTQSRKRKKRTHKKDKRGMITGRVSIHQRPEIVNQREHFGDWEVDLIEGRNHKEFIVTLVERKSAFCLMQKTPDKKAKTIEKTVVNLLAPYKEKVHSITSDNGKEFANHQNIAKKLGADFYFADPYASWQRGLNENTNKLIRQYIPKKSNFQDVDHQIITNINLKLNKRPRKNLNFKNPLYVFIHNFV